MRVAIAHEWLVKYAGSERCVEEMLRLFPDSLLLTTLLRGDAVPPPFHDARPSLLQLLPGATHYHEWLLPLMPAAWKARPKVRDVDVVISSSHACAKAVRIEKQIPHLCYCHTPMRYAWDFSAEATRVPLGLRAATRLAMGGFRAWDRRAARGVTAFVANSTAVAQRIARFYGRSARVIHPPVRTEYFTPGGEREDYFLFVGRLVSYKRADLVVEAFRDLPLRLIVVGTGSRERDAAARAPSNVTFVGQVADEQLRELYRSARALVYPANEDFGIVMAEAHACGTPVIGFAGGGALDIVEDGVTGWLLDRSTVEEVRRAIVRATVEQLDPAAIRHRAERFSRGRFRAEMKDAVEAVASEAGRRRKQRPEGRTEKVVGIS